MLYLTWTLNSCHQQTCLCLSYGSNENNLLSAAMQKSQFASAQKKINLHIQNVSGNITMILEENIDHMFLIVLVSVELLKI